MKTFVEKYTLIAQIKDAMQWYEALLKKAESELKWYHTWFAPFSKKMNACNRAEWRISILETLLQQAGLTAMSTVKLDWYETDLIYNLKPYDKFLEES